MRGTRARIYALLGILLLCLFEAQGAFCEEELLKDRLLGDEDAPWEIDAEREGEIHEDTYILKGGVVIRKGDHVLHAQEATYDTKTGIAEVSGDVRFEMAGDILECEEGVFNLNEKTGRVSNARLFLKESPYSIHGGQIEKLGKDTYSVKDFRLTTCEGPNPAWTITGSKVEVTIEGYGKVKDFAFRVREVPIFYMPYLLFPVKTKRQTGLLLPNVGYSDRNGGSVEVPFYWAISDQADATFYGRYMTERGYMQGLEFRYVADQDSKGIFLFDILSDDIEEKDENDPDQMEVSPFARTNHTRYWLRGRMDQDLPYGVVARLDMDFVSDQDYLREFEGDLFGFEARPDLREESGRPMEERYSPTRRSSLRLSHGGEAYSLQGSSSYYQVPENPSEDNTPQPLGALDFALLPQQIPYLPVFFRFDTDYQYIWRDDGTKGHGLSVNPAISYPMWFGRYLALDSSISYTRNMEWVDDPQENIDHQSKDAYQVQARLSTILERVFGIERGSMKKLKHKVTPSLAYEYGVFPDERDKSPWFNPLDQESKVNRVVFSIENLFDARMENEEGSVSYRQLATFTLTQGYDLSEARRDEAPGEEKEALEPLLATMVLRPFPGLHFLGRTKWDYEKDKLTTVDLSLDLSLPRSGGRRDRFAVDYVDVEGGNKALNFSADVHLSHGFSAGTLLNRDLDLKKSSYSTYWLEYESQCWGVRLGAKKEDEETSFMLSFHLFGLNW
jgi:LPS-assembly protein